MDERLLGGSGTSITRIILGCGNFGGIGSSPAFFGQGTSKPDAFRLLDTAWDAGITTYDTADAYGGGRSESFIGEWLATKGSDVRDRIVIATKTFNPMDEGADHGLGRGGSSARSTRACAGSASSAWRSISRTTSTPTRRRRRRSRRSPAWSRPARSGRSVRRTSPASSSQRRSSSRALEGLPRYEWVQNGFSLLEQGDRETVFPVCREHGLGYTPFSPLAGGWLTGKYRRGEAPPAGSRMTLRPEPYVGYASDRVFDALEALERCGRRARRLDGRARPRLGARPARADGDRGRPGPRRPPGTGLRSARHHSLPCRPRPSDGGVLVSVLVLSEHDVRGLLDMESCIDGDGGHPRAARARRADEPVALPRSRRPGRPRWG